MDTVVWKSEFPKVVALYLLIAIAALYQIFLGRVYQPQGYLDQSFPWRYEHTGTELTTEGLDVGNPWLVDAALFVGPQDAVIEHYLSQGEFPLWNPRQFSGHPLLANSQSEMLYPVKIALTTLFSRENAHNFYLFLHLWFAGPMFYLFARLHHSRRAAFVGGLTWMLGGFSAHYLESKMGVVAVTFPLTMFATEMLLRQPGGRRACLLGLCGGYLFLTAHKQFTLYVYLMAGVYFLARLAAERTKQQWYRPFLWAIPSLLMAFLLGAPLLAPYLSLGMQAERGVAPLAALFAENRLFPETLITLFLPEFWGSPQTGFYLSRMASATQTPIELTNHIGVCGMLLAVIGLFRRNFQSRFFSIASIYLILATSIQIFYWPLYKFVPVMNLLTPSRILMLLHFSLAMLACHGLGQLENGRGGRRAAVTYISLVAIVGWWIWQVTSESLFFQRCMQHWYDSGVLTARTPNFSNTEDYLRLMVAAVPKFYTVGNPAIWLPLLCGLALLIYSSNLSPSRKAVVLVLAIAMELCFFLNRWNPTVEKGQTYPRFPALEVIEGVTHRVVGIWTPAPPNGLTAYELSTPAGYDSVRSGRYVLFFKVWQQNELLQYQICFARPRGPLFWKWCTMVGVQYVYTSPHWNGEIPPQWELVYDRELKVYKNPEKVEKAWLVSGWTSVPNQDRALRKMLEPTFDPGTSAVVETELPSHSGQGVGGKAELVTYSANTVELAVTANSKSLLVINDSYYPDWVAYVDGQQKPIYPTNAAFRGIFLEKGEHRVELRFKPKSLTVGWILFGVGVLLGAVLWSRKSVSEPTE